MQPTARRKRRGYRYTFVGVLAATGMLLCMASAPCWAAARARPDRRAFQLGGWASRSALWFNPFAPWAALSAGASDAEAMSAPSILTSRAASRPAREASGRAGTAEAGGEPDKVILIPTPRLASEQKPLFIPRRPCVRTPYKPPLPPPPPP
jgi:hypothetical protein